jgi:arylsulfatase B/arylsulfatase I/J
MMSRLDTAIGDFVELLKEKAMWQDTIMWVTTDNGGMCQFGPTILEASAASNYPLRAGKATLFEGGVRGVSFVTGGRVPGE